MALSSFSRINKTVLVRKPSSDGPLSTDGLLPPRSGKVLAGGAPQTILLLSWGDAEERHIEKYTNLYTELYPSAKIILVKSGMAEFFWRSKQTQRKLVEPAVKMLRDTEDDSLLVHIMSNAGSVQWCTVNQIYMAETGRSLGNVATVLDSAPGRSRFGQTWNAFSRSLPRAFFPRMILGFVFGIVLCLMHVGKYILPGSDMLETMLKQLNEPSPTGKNARRCYMYAKEDDIIGWEDIEEHAKDAEKKGWLVERVMFRDSTHVGHFKQNPGLYQAAIERTWLGRSKLRGD